MIILILFLLPIFLYLFYEIYCIYIEKNILNTYVGKVTHERLSVGNKPKFKFNYKIEYDLFSLKKKPNKFYRQDFIGKEKDLYSFFIYYIQQLEGNKYINIDNIFSMTNLRYYGLSFNPITFYFCKSSEHLKYLILEVHNTPWNQKTLYLLKIENNKIENNYRLQKKKMHVSPFNPSENQYYYFTLMIDKDLFHLHINLLNLDKKTVLYTNLILKSEKYKKFKYPYSYLTIIGIYWQALKLFLRKQKIYKINKSLVTTS